MLTISCITCNFYALNIINRKKAGGDVIGGYSNLLLVGILSVIFQLAFSCVRVYSCSPPSGSGRLVAANAPVCGRRASALTTRSPVRLNNRIRAEILRAQLFSVQFASARVFRAGESSSSEQCSSTFEIEQSSRLLTSSSRDDLSSKGTSVRASSRLLCDVVR